MRAVDLLRRAALARPGLKRALEPVKHSLPYSFYVRRRAQRQAGAYPARTVSHRYGPAQLRVRLEDPLAEQWYDLDWPEPPEFAFLRPHGLGRGARVFDLGAHQCVLALVLAEIVGSEGSVVAVEADPHNVAVARRNRELNGADGLLVVHAAVAGAPGRLRFTASLNGYVHRGRGWGVVEVPAVTVDELSARFGAPDVIYVDVEGFEGDTLGGARRTLQEERPSVFVEVHAGCGLEAAGSSVDAVLSSFADGFRLYAAPGGGALDPYEFRPLEAASDFLNQRFFLIAVPG